MASSARTPEGEVINRLRAKARGRALNYLIRTHFEEYSGYLKEAREKVGGCLAHEAGACSMGVDSHTREHRTLQDVTRYKARARLGRKYPDAYLDAYGAEVEYLLETEGPRKGAE